MSDPLYIVDDGRGRHDGAKVDARMTAALVDTARTLQQACRGLLAYLHALRVSSHKTCSLQVWPLPLR